MNLRFTICRVPLRLQLLKCLSFGPNNGTNDSSNHRCFVRASSWVWHFEKMYAKVNAKSLVSRTEQTSGCRVWREILTQTHTELAKCFWQQLRVNARFLSYLPRQCLLNIFSDKWYDSLRRRSYNWSPVSSEHDTKSRRQTFFIGTWTSDPKFEGSVRFPQKNYGDKSGDPAVCSCGHIKSPTVVTISYCLL
jgi:hypothetical protein